MGKKARSKDFAFFFFRRHMKIGCLRLDIILVMLEYIFIIIDYVGFLDWEHTIGYNCTIKFVYGRLKDGILQEFKEL